MEKALNIAILIILVIVGVISVMGVTKTNQVLTKINQIADKIDATLKREANQNQNQNQPSMRRDVTAGELSSILRSKLSGDDVRELNVKFNQ